MKKIKKIAVFFMLLIIISHVFGSRAIVKASSDNVSEWSYIQ